jgi:dTMP kinase
VNRGRLIAFEGIDGCGKTTQISRLAESLRRAGHDPVVTAEPTDGEFGRRIRAMASGSAPAVAPEEELRWFVEDRREHVAGCIAPALAAGRPVLTDRYFLSTVAYQGANGFDAERILAESEAEFPIPDLVLLLELDVETALARVQARGARLEGAFEAGIGSSGWRASSLDRAPYITRLDAGAARTPWPSRSPRVREQLDLP